MLSLSEQVDNYLIYCEYQKNLDKKTLKAYRIDLWQYICYTCHTLRIFRYNSHLVILIYNTHYFRDYVNYNLLDMYDRFCYTTNMNASSYNSAVSGYSATYHQYNMKEPKKT